MFFFLSFFFPFFPFSNASFDDDDDDDDDGDRFYTALFSALEQTHCARM